MRNASQKVALDLGGGRTLSITQQAGVDPEDPCPSWGKLSAGTVECYFMGEGRDPVVLDGPGLLALLEREVKSQ